MLESVDIHLYATPAGQPGFGWHYDAEEVFVLQTAGEKEWQLRKNTVNPWPLMETLPRDQHYEREQMPVMTCHLHAGDWLYIPGGYWHSTRAGGESISLSIGLKNATAIDVYDFVRTQLLNSLRWRQRLPCSGLLSPLSTEALHEHYRPLLAELADDLGALLRRPNVIDAFLADRADRLYTKDV